MAEKNPPERERGEHNIIIYGRLWWGPIHGPEDPTGPSREILLLLYVQGWNCEEGGLGFSSDQKRDLLGA